MRLSTLMLLIPTVIIAAVLAVANRGDVRLSLDGIPVVFHDHELKRLTGMDGYLRQRTAAELQAMRVG